MASAAAAPSAAATPSTSREALPHLGDEHEASQSEGQPYPDGRTDGLAPTEPEPQRDHDGCGELDDECDADGEAFEGEEEQPLGHGDAEHAEGEEQHDFIATDAQRMATSDGHDHEHDEERGGHPQFGEACR